MGEEVPLGADLNDWASDRVTDSQRALLTQIFRFFTALLQSASSGHSDL